MAGQRAFNPDSSGYDIETAKELMELYPLTTPKPNRPGRFDRETIDQDDAFQAWVWHGEENDWVKPGGTLDPRTGMYLKGMAKNAPKDSEAYKSMRLGIEEEERRGNKVTFKDGRYYSVPKKENDMAGQKGMEDRLYKEKFPSVQMYSVDGEWVPSGDITQLYGEEEGDKIRKNSVSTFMYFVDDRGWVPEMQLAYEESSDAKPSLSEKPTSKSIDDIMQQSNIMEVLAPRDVTNVEVKGPAPQMPDSRYGIQPDPIQELLDMADPIGRGSLEDLLMKMKQGKSGIKTS